MITMIIMNNQNCNRCEYEWISRVESPKECPRCKTRLDIEVLKNV